MLPIPNIEADKIYVPNYAQGYSVCQICIYFYMSREEGNYAQDSSTSKSSAFFPREIVLVSAIEKDFVPDS